MDAWEIMQNIAALVEMRWPSSGAPRRDFRLAANSDGWGGVAPEYRPEIVTGRWVAQWGGNLAQGATPEEAATALRDLVLPKLTEDLDKAIETSNESIQRLSDLKNRIQKRAGDLE